MKAVVFLILAFLVAAMWLGAGNAVCIGGIALGVVALLIAGLSRSSSPPTPLPTPSVTTRVEITKAVYEERLDYGWPQNLPQIPTQNNYGRQHNGYLPANWEVVTPPSTSQRHITVENNSWPQIPLQQSGQHQLPGGKVLTYEEIARLIEQMNQAK